MVAEPLASPSPSPARPRGGEVSRIEGFSDAVFGFALTLLVVALEVPRTFPELMEVIWGFPAFAVSFAVLFAVWYRHHTFFRRYALQDTTTAMLTGVLLFVVLFYVYPLRFLFDLFFERFFHLPARAAKGLGPAIVSAQVPTVFLFYGAGVIAVELAFALLYRHAWRRRDALGLSAVERLRARTSIEGALLSAAIGLLSVLIAATRGWIPVGWAGWIYFLNGPVRGFHGWYAGAREQRLTGGD